MTITIIAEAGVNHNGVVDLGKKMVDVAAESGADIIKFQTFSADLLVTRSAKRAGYQVGADGIYQYEMLKKLELGWTAYSEYKRLCEKKDIELLSTAFDKDSLARLIENGQKKIKIPSGEITNIPYLRYVGGYGYPVFLSTGMANLNEIEAALTTLEQAGTGRDCVTVMHCSTDYPAKMSDLNLRAIETLRNTFGVDVGYSDHTLGIEVSIAAAALGATVIEKHFTLDKTLPGPDHKASINPEELKEMVAAIRNIESALGGHEKVPSEQELDNLQVVRRSIVALKDIKKGDVLSEANICTKRPGTGVSASRWDEVIGSIAVRDFLEDELIVL